MKKWLIPALCALPLVGIALWFFSGKNIGNFATIALFLACPLLHLTMGHGGNDHHKHHKPPV